MSRKLSHSARFPFEPKLVYETVTQREFWEEVTDEFKKFTQSDIELFETSPECTDIVLKQTLPHEYLPPIAQAVWKIDLVVTRKDHYGPLTPEGTSEGTFTASVPAGPGWLKGWQELFPNEHGCTLRKTSEVKVYIPFVGSKLEQLMLVNLVELAKAEAEFTTTYIYKKLGLNPADYPETYGERSKYYQPERFFAPRGINLDTPEK